MGRFLSLCVLVTAVGLPFTGFESFAQSLSSPDASQAGVVLTKLVGPIYSPLARQTRISGDVALQLSIRQDGSVESAVVESGHPLLQQAALDSAQHSEFECRKCTDTVTLYRMRYTFQLVGSTSCCTTTEVSGKNKEQDLPYPRVTQSQNHVTVADQTICICDPAPDSWKVRSIKCLYLWRCGFR